jgi:dsDNA-specific endonuclease/ATPase MutS2
MDLDQATLDALDWTPLLHALSEQSRTSLGARACLTMVPMRTVAPIEAAFDVTDEVLELWREGMDLPIGEVADIRAVLVGATKGEVLDITALRQVRDTAEGLDRLRSACASRRIRQPRSALRTPLARARRPARSYQWSTRKHPQDPRQHPQRRQLRRSTSRQLRHPTARPLRGSHQSARQALGPGHRSRDEQLGCYRVHRAQRGGRGEQPS